MTEKFIQHKAIRVICYSVICAFFLISWISFIYIPMTGDIKVFLGSARQSSYISSSILIGAFQAWELKSVLSRLLICIIYRISSLFFAYGTLEFEITCKFVYSLIILIGTFITIRLLVERKKALFYSVILSTVFFATHTCCQMQVEMTVSVILLISCSLYINSIRTQKRTTLKLIVSGILIGTVFFFKSILILMSISMLATIIMYLFYTGESLSLKRLLIVVFGSLLSLLAIFLLILVINPREIQDIINASAFQSTLFSVHPSIKEILSAFISNHIKNILFIPITILGIVALIINTFLSLRNKEFKLFLCHVILWIMPAIFIMLSNKYFAYHFAVYIYPSVIELYFFIIYKNKVLNCAILILAILTGIWYMFAFSFFSGNFRVYYDLNIEAYEKTEESLIAMSFDSDETVLYLDGGCAGYCLGNKSYLKYYYPLPLQRLPENSELECYRDSLSAVLDYEGKYIALDSSWFFGLQKNQSIKEKIKNEYQIIGTYYMFSPPFSINPDNAHVSEMEIYVKKNAITNN